MWVLLLLLGIVTTAAGLALVASAAMNDADIVTPAVAAIGGLLLIGLALVARELQRIEQALVGRPGEATVAGASVAEASARIPFPPKPKINAPTGPVAAEAAPAPSAQPSPSAEPAAANQPPGLRHHLPFRLRRRPWRRGLSSACEPSSRRWSGVNKARPLMLPWPW